MRRLTTAFFFTAIGILGFAPASRAEEADTRVADMPYSDCLSIIAETAQELGEPPVQLVSTDHETTVRINAQDGFVTVSCTRDDNKIRLSRSAVPEAAGMTASR